MGLDPHCSHEVESLVAFVNRLNIPHVITSTCRPGAITISGNMSYHSMGSALDLAGPSPTVDSEVLANIFRAFEPYEGHLAELIYAGPQVSYNIKNGKRVGKYAQSIHHNHVHIAIKPGQNVDSLAPLAAPQDPTPVSAQEANERTDLQMAQLVARPQGGYVILQTRDGGVFTYDGAPFFGSLVGNGSGPAIGLAWTPSGNGYWILQADGAVFSFGDAQYHGGVNPGANLHDAFGSRIPVGLTAKGNGYVIVGADLSNDGSPFDYYSAGV